MATVRYMDIREIRLQALFRLLAEHGGKRVAVSKLIGKSPSQISQWLSRNRTITEESARDIERRAGKLKGWMDSTDGIHLEARTSAFVQPSPPPSITLADALEVLGIELAKVSPDLREAVATNLAGWARDGGKDHWRQAVLGFLQAPPTKRTGT